jgi:exopolysaccharide biosynthesis protein
MKAKITCFMTALLCLGLLVATSCSGGTSTAGAASTSSSAATSGIDSTASAGTATTETIATETTPSEDASVQTTLGSEADDKTTITVDKVTIGSGSDTVTYYVADVLLASGADLQSAFSSGEFGGKTQDTSAIAEENDAALAINGDFYSARNDGIVIRNGVVYRDQPARTGLAIYRDGTMKVYDETRTSAEDLLAEGVWNTYSFGPALLVDGELGEDLDSYEAEANPKHPIQGSQPRTGIGIIGQNHFVFVVVDGRDEGYSKGVTLTEFAQIFRELGCTTAYNLDGGGSSTLYYQGEVVNQPAGRGSERAISDILYVE